MTARDCVGKRLWLYTVSCGKSFVFCATILCPARVEVPDCVWVCFVLGCANFVLGRAQQFFFLHASQRVKVRLKLNVSAKSEKCSLRFAQKL